MELIYFNWFDVPSRREGLRLVRADGSTNESVLISEDSNYDHDLFFSLLKKGWELTSDWKERFKHNGLTQRMIDAEIDCISRSERWEIEKESKKIEEKTKDNDKQEYEIQEETDIELTGSREFIQGIANAWKNKPYLRSIKFYNCKGEEVNELSEDVCTIHANYFYPNSVDKIETTVKLENVDEKVEENDKTETAKDIESNECICDDKCGECDKYNCNHRRNIECQSLNDYIETGRSLFGEDFGVVTKDDTKCPYDCRGVNPELNKYNDLREIFGKELSDADILSKLQSSLKTIEKLIEYISTIR